MIASTDAASKLPRLARGCANSEQVSSGIRDLQRRTGIAKISASALMFTLGGRTILMTLQLGNDCDTMRSLGHRRDDVAEPAMGRMVV
jgi:hypothetical protein